MRHGIRSGRRFRGRRSLVGRAPRAPLARGLLASACVALQAGATPPLGDGHDEKVSAAEIYHRVLANSFDSIILEATLLSTRDGRFQPIRVQVLWRRYPEDSEEGSEGVLSRTVLRFLAPQDLRHIAYLVVDRSDGPDDQFLFLPALRRTRRVNLSDLKLAGTDFEVADLLPREWEHAAYRRVGDEVFEGFRCFVLEATPNRASQTNYSRLRYYVERERFVPVRVRYWDLAGAEVRELAAEVHSIREIDGRFLPTRATVHDLLEGSATRLQIDLVAADPEIPARYFSKRQLETRRLKIPKRVIGSVRRF